MATVNTYGNILPVISDKPIPHQNGQTVDYWLAEVRQATDYSPFGVQLQTRNLFLTVLGNEPYRYGFQNQEVDPEIKGEGNNVNYKYRMHDPRLGRFFARDPLASKYPWNSVYAFSENIVINAVELEGLEKVIKHVYNYESKSFVITEKYINNSLNENVNLYVYQNPDGQINRQVYKSWTSGREYVAPAGQVDNSSLISAFNGESRGERVRVNATPSMFDGTILSPNRADYHNAPFTSVEFSIQGTAQLGSTSHTIGLTISDSGGDNGMFFRIKNETAIDYLNAEMSVSGGVEFQGNITRGNNSKTRTDIGLELEKGPYSAGVQSSTSGQVSVKAGIQPKLSIPIYSTPGAKTQTVIDHTQKNSNEK